MASPMANWDGTGASTSRSSSAPPRKNHPKVITPRFQKTQREPNSTSNRKRKQGPDQRTPQSRQVGPDQRTPQSRQVPRHLKDVPSRIKDDVKKDVAYYKHKVN